MAEFPNMPIWIGDLLGDRNVMVMDGQDMGAYMLLLFYAWQNNGKIPNDPQTLMRIARVPLGDWQRVWGAVSPCWQLNTEGTDFIQGRVVDELSKLRTLVEKKREAGIASGKARGHRDLNRRTAVERQFECSNRTDEHTGVGDGDGVGDREGGKKKEGSMSSGKPTVEQVAAYMTTIELPTTEAERFHDFYESNGWRVGKNPMKNWQCACRNWKRNYKNYGAQGGIKPIQSKNDKPLSQWEITNRIDAITKEIGKTEFHKDEKDVAERRAKLFDERKRLKHLQTGVV